MLINYHHLKQKIQLRRVIMNNKKMKSVWESDIWNKVPRWKLRWWDLQVKIELFFIKLFKKI